MQEFIKLYVRAEITGRKEKGQTAGSLASELKLHGIALST
jgi:hypothetical protein